MAALSLLALLLLGAPFALVNAASQVKKLPSFMRKCSYKDPELDKCHTEHGQEAVPHLVKGDPYYHLPVLDPFTVPEVRIQMGSATSNLDMHCRNITLRGLAGTQILSNKLYRKNSLYKLNSKIPHLQIECDYTVDGRVLLLPIKGSGKGNFTFDNAIVFYEQKFSIEKRDGHDYLKLPPSSATFNCSRAHFHLDNLFNGDPVLGNTVNSFLNENWREVVDDLGQPFVDVAAEIIYQISKIVVQDVPLDEIYNDYP